MKIHCLSSNLFAEVKCQRSKQQALIQIYSIYILVSDIVFVLLFSWSCGSALCGGGHQRGGQVRHHLLYHQGRALAPGRRSSRRIVTLTRLLFSQVLKWTAEIWSKAETPCPSKFSIIFTSNSPLLIAYLWNGERSGKTVQTHHRF